MLLLHVIFIYIYSFKFFSFFRGTSSTVNCAINQSKSSSIFNKTNNHPFFNVLTTPVVPGSIIKIIGRIEEFDVQPRIFIILFENIYYYSIIVIDRYVHIQHIIEMIKDKQNFLIISRK